MRTIRDSLNSPTGIDRLGEHDADIVRERVSRLFKFIAATYAKRNPVPRQVSDHEWVLRFSDIPDVPTIDLLTAAQIDAVEDEDADADQPAVVLRCGRPKITTAPAAPEILVDWLGRDWQDCRSEPHPIESRNERLPDGATQVVPFTDELQRVKALEEYRLIWRAWAAAERISVAAGEVFERLYSLRGTIERDGERFELGVADGTLVWSRRDGGIRHPLLFRPVRLEFSPEIPEFRIVETGAPTEFYSPLFRSMADVEGTNVGKLRLEAEKLDPHPLGGAEVDAFLSGVASRLSARGQFVGTSALGPERDTPVIGRTPMFLLRKRTMGFARAIDAVADAAQTAAELSHALCNVVGKPLAEFDANPDAGAEEASPKSAVFDANEDTDVLFTKQANAEQLDIVRSLRRNDCVLVQGPPGTGKTHTIANLLGHLLAEGKSVLVVSHTTKALKVLREKVVDALQPLCVSVLDSAEDDASLKSSVEGIVARLGAADIGSLERDVARYSSERDALLSEIRELRSAVLNARMDEVRPIIFGGESASPISAAKEVAAGVGVHDWIPQPVKLGEPASLVAGELLELYRSNESVTSADEAALQMPLPDLNGLPTPERFAELLSERQSLAEVDREFRTELWTDLNADVSFDGILESFSAAIALLDDRPSWTLRLVFDGAGSPAQRKTWESLFAEIDAIQNEAASASEALVSHQPQPTQDLDLAQAAAAYSAIATEVRRTGKSPGFVTLLTRREWKIAIDGATVGANSKPRLPEHFEAIALSASLALRRDNFRRRWVTQVTQIGGPDLGTEVAPETLSARYRPLMQAALDWIDKPWATAVAVLESVGFRWNELRLEADTKFAADDEVMRLRHITKELLPPIFAAQMARLRWQAVTSELAAAHDIAAKWDSEGPAATLSSALVSKLPAAYRKAYDEVNRLNELTKNLSIRRALIIRLERSAPAWAAAIRARAGEHGDQKPPGGLTEAWRFAQFCGELDRRNAVNMPEVISTLETRRAALRETTALLVDAKAWLAQVQRTTMEQRTALMSFVQAKKRIGRGTGKRAATFAKVAREALSLAKGAVPVWIMPIVKAAEMFDPHVVKFDVVIVDEASQSDTTGLLAFYLGRQIIVVGDDEQVSPSDVGTKTEDSQYLIDEHLQGIPAAELFDGKQSLYDIAKRAFSGTTCLLEHFRCVPDIIRFSNHLSYDGAIRPLREARPDLPFPSVVPHRVSSRGSEHNVNEDEARMVAALAAACVEQPEYIGKTIGVVSLLGEDQARRIEQLLRRLLPPEELEARRLLVGNAAQFQGDERHVMFLSMVGTGVGVPLTMSDQRPTQQRYNVAASRAQDQMWVVYSLDPTTELKPGDLRRRLIEHAMNPDALAANESVAKARAESPFEIEVIHRLSSAGYKVTAQKWVGAYRIDIVVEGATGGRLAVECDGERFHRLEDVERDAERQAVLERVGPWIFERIRGSAFYRNPDVAMRPVFERLRTLRIAPFSGSAPNDDMQAPSTGLLVKVRSRAAEILESLSDEPIGSGGAQRSRSRFARKPT